MSKKDHDSLNRRQFIQQAFAGLTTLSLQGCSFSTNMTHSTPQSTAIALDPLFYLHDHDEHPENAARLRAVDHALNHAGLWSQLTPSPCRKATIEEILFAHAPAYIEEINILSGGLPGYYDNYHPDTYINEYTYDAALMAAGSAIELNLAVYDRKVQNGFALLRPPGHHAKYNEAMGFCIFNSDVIAARALQKYRGVKKVAIIDFDVHHGNGTQDLTYNDPSILAVSIHQHPYWPMTGAFKYQGEGAATGMNLNIPFPKGAGNQSYLQAFHELIYPKLKAFQPEHIIVFAGYDAHWQDPLAEHRLSIKGFNQLVAAIKTASEEICDGRLSLSLGGGYLPETLSKAVMGSINELLGSTQPADIDPFGEDPRGEVFMTQEIKRYQEALFS